MTTIDDEFGYLFAMTEEVIPVAEPLPIRLVNGSYIEPSRQDNEEHHDDH